MKKEKITERELEREKKLKEVKEKDKFNKQKIKK